MDLIVCDTSTGHLVIADSFLVEIERPPGAGSRISKLLGMVAGFFLGGVFGAAFLSASSEDSGLSNDLLNLKPKDSLPENMELLDRVATCSGDHVPEQLIQSSSWPRGLEDEAELTFFPKRRVHFVRVMGNGAVFANVDGTKNLELRIRFWQVGKARTQLIRAQYPLR